MDEQLGERAAALDVARGWAGSTPVASILMEDSSSGSIMAQRVADRINQLIAADSGMPERGAARVIAERARAAGHEISGVYLNQLRRAEHKNPTLRALEAIAAAFGVDVGFLVSEEADSDAIPAVDPALSTALNTTGVRDLALRAAALSPEDLSVVMTMVTRLRRD